MARVSILLCLVLLVTLGVVISVSFADNIEVKSKDLESSKKEKNVDHHNSKDKEKGGEKVDDGVHQVGSNDDENDKKEKKKGHDDDVSKKGDQHEKKDNVDEKKSAGHDKDEKKHKDTKKDGHGEEDDDDDDDDDTDDDTDDDDDDEDETDGDDNEKANIGLYELKKGNLTVKFTNWGASIMSLHFPDKNGKIDDIVLGYDSVKSYKTDKVYFGATVGRVANRIGKAQFKLNGKEYKTSANDGKNTLHGGKKGFGDVVWAVAKHKYDGKSPHIVFTYTSPDGDQGFPGELNATVTYKLVKDNELSVVMEAKPNDKATPVNLAHHTYWNLGGHNAGDILSEEIQILGSSYTPVDGELIPTGQISPVKGTPYDFLQLRPIKDNMKDLKTGYDINYCLDGQANQMRKIVELVDKKSGRKMELSGNQPGLQFYTGGMLKDIKGKNGAVNQAYGGLCLETQSYPDALNYPKFPSQIVEPGKNYKHTMLFKFSIVS
ncbi:PREDICTED: aldose 1-epimerase-like [Camelina sativa]|uniref:Aldose 1-epimerase-like n=1 Tax=Camelina sativa TaxID=90675 RepID=A0ABM0T321_CAMSA|nr:PREDICTED: aldose 1-epimerase-like [Camelina sativa]